MERTQIIHQILESERAARTLYNEAEQRQAGLSEYLDTKIAELRAKYYDEAEQEIAEAEKRIKRNADEAIAKQDIRMKQELSDVKSRFEQHRNEWAEFLFESIVNQ